MRTRTLRGHWLSDEGRRNLRILADLPDSARGKLIGWLPKWETFPTIGEKEYKYLVEETGETPEAVVRSLGLMRDFIVWLAENEDDRGEDLYKDLVEHPADCGEADLTSLKQMFEQLDPIVGRHRISIKRQASLLGGAPTLKSASLQPIIKPVSNRPFDSKSQRLEDYKPELIDYCVAVQVELETSADGHVAFQMDMATFDRFITDLLALQSEAREAKSVVEQLRSFANGS